MVAEPKTPKFCCRVVLPAAVRVPPKVAAPVPTLKVLAPVTRVVPFRETLPVEVEKAPVPRKV